MDRNELFKLYNKERNYQQIIFGEYKHHPKFNVATFLQFLEKYLNEAKTNYADKWTKDLPSWLKSCNESENDATAPVKTYEALVKLFALTGAALESYIDIDVESWREEGIKPKWKEY